MSAPELTPEERDIVRGKLAELRRAEAEQVEKLKPLAARSDAVGIERVEWPVLVEMAARAEILRRLHAKIADGCALLGIDYDPNIAVN